MGFRFFFLLFFLGGGESCVSFFFDRDRSDRYLIDGLRSNAHDVFITPVGMWGGVAVGVALLASLVLQQLGKRRGGTAGGKSA